MALYPYTHWLAADVNIKTYFIFLHFLWSIYIYMIFSIISSPHIIIPSACIKKGPHLVFCEYISNKTNKPQTEREAPMYIPQNILFFLNCSLYTNNCICRYALFFSCETKILLRCSFYINCINSDL